MKLRRISLQNVRSFLEKQELLLDGEISIIIGPNGGGKTNLLDATVTTLRRHLLKSRYLRPSATPEQPDRQEFYQNDQLNSAKLSRHSSGGDLDQIIELDIEVTQVDLDNISAMRLSASNFDDIARRRYINASFDDLISLGEIKVEVGDVLTYVILNDSVVSPESPSEKLFYSYMQLFDVDSRIRESTGAPALAMPILSLPVNRASGGIQSSVSLASYNDYDYLKSVDAAHSRMGGSITSLAIGRLATKYRLLLEEDSGLSKERFYDDPDISRLSAALLLLGYKWELVPINPLTNQYDIQLEKQGSKFLVGEASSGEQELLTYLFAIYAIGVKDALVVIDEPELHLHPQWQSTLLDLFEKLSSDTGNQFLMATHSPTFVSPISIQYVSRVYSDNQRSKISRLSMTDLPGAKHLFAIVNSQNNEKIFFCNKVILVEGISDRLFFADLFKKIRKPQQTYEIVPVGGKGLFAAYGSLLEACHIPFSIIADRDYLREVGGSAVRPFFSPSGRDIKRAIVNDLSSMDGATFLSELEVALEGRSYERLMEIFEYIKQNRTHIRALSDAEEIVLAQDIQEKADRGIFILSRGNLESYLPDGYQGKDLERLITLVTEEGYWEAMPELLKGELARIADSAMPH